jgi:3-hexulose-6-phosphate synthase/6-phospho-3-hexuloisomerase
VSLIKNLTRATLTRPLVQLSLDLMSNADAFETASIGVEAGVDWLEVGTPLVLAEGLHAVRMLRKEFPHHPIVVDLKTMDGGYLEAQMMGEAGADAVVVMSRAHEATIERVCEAGSDFGVLVMGDDLGAANYPAAAERLESLGVGMVLHHVGFDERGKHEGLSPLTDLSAVVAATSVPVQAVGGLSIDQAIRCPDLGAPVVVFGAPLAISESSFTAQGDDLRSILTEACRRVHKAPVQYPAR